MYQSRLSFLWSQQQDDGQRGSAKQKHYIPRLSPLFALPVHHSALKTEESTRQIHVNKSAAPEPSRTDSHTHPMVNKKASLVFFGHCVIEGVIRRENRLQIQTQTQAETCMNKHKQNSPSFEPVKLVPLQVNCETRNKLLIRAEETEEQLVNATMLG